MFNKYKTFVKKFIWWYVAANVVILVWLIIAAPNIVDKIVSGKEVTVTDITTVIQPETDVNLQRVKQLGLQVGLTDVNIGSCPDDVGKTLACYIPKSNKTFVTQLGLTLNDTKLYCVLNHEAIHKWQDDTGKIVFNANGSIANSEELEAYAYANDGC